MFTNLDLTAPKKLFSEIQALAQKQPARPVSPTLIIGLGGAGYAVLSGLKKQVLDDNQGQMPDSLQLLWLGSAEHAQVETGKVELGEHEQIILTLPDFETANRVIAQNRDRYNYLDWWFAEQRHSRHSRGNGRFSLFWLLYFENQAQKLSDSLKYINARLSGSSETRYRVFFVTNLFEPLSAILIDLAHLVQQALSSDKTRFRIPILLLNNSGENRQDEQKAGIIASFRELERFMSGREQRLDIGGFGKSALTPNFLFDHLMAFDHPQAHLQLPDLLFALIQPGIAEKFNETLVNRSGMENAGQFLFSNAAIFNYFFPIFEIRRACAAKLLRDELFNGSYAGGPGQFPQEAQAGGRPDDFTSLAKSFLRDDRRQFEDSAFPLDVLASAAERKWLSPTRQVDIPDLPQMLQNRLSGYLTLSMSAQRSDTVIARYGALGWAQRFLQALKMVLRDADYFLSQQRGNLAALELARKNRDLLKIVDEQGWLGEIERWQRSIGNLRVLSNENVRNSQENLQKTVQTSAARQVLLSKDADSANPADFSAPYYREFLEQSQGRQAPAAIRNRTGWLWKPEKDFTKTRLYWVVFGPQDDGENWKSVMHSYQPDELRKAFARLANLAEVFTRPIGQDETIINLLREKHSADVVRPFAAPQFLLEMLPVPNRTRARDQYLAGIDQAQLMEWTSENRQVELSQQTMRLNDPTRVIHMVLERNLPKEALRFLDTYQFSYYREPSLHIFTEEQNAARFEREYGIKAMLRPRMVRLMGDLQAFKTLLRCVLYGWVYEKYDGSAKTWCICALGMPNPVWLVDGNYRPGSLEAALFMALIYIPWASMNSAHDFYNQGRGKYRKTLEMLGNACESYQKTLGQKNDPNAQKLRDAHQQQIEDWLSSPDDFLHSLGLALKGMFDREIL